MAMGVSVIAAFRGRRRDFRNVLGGEVDVSSRWLVFSIKGFEKIEEGGLLSKEGISVMGESIVSALRGAANSVGMCEGR